MKKPRSRVSIRGLISISDAGRPRLLGFFCPPSFCPILFVSLVAKTALQGARKSCRAQSGKIFAACVLQCSEEGSSGRILARGLEGFVAEALGFAAEEIGRAGQVVGDRFELGFGIARAERAHRFAERLKEPLDLADPLGNRANHDLAAIAGVRVAAHEPSALEPIDYRSDGPGGQPRPVGQVAGGRLGGAAEDFEALVVGGVEPQPIGDRLVQRHRHGPQVAAGAAEPVGDLAFPLSFARRQNDAPFTLPVRLGATCQKSRRSLDGSAFPGRAWERVT